MKNKVLKTGGVSNQLWELLFYLVMHTQTPFTCTTVSQGLTPADKALLEEDGVCLPSHRERKRKRKYLDEHVSGNSEGIGASSLSEQKWEEVKQYLDPNPQLKGTEKGKYAIKVG